VEEILLEVDALHFVQRLLRQHGLLHRKQILFLVGHHLRHAEVAVLVAHFAPELGQFTLEVHLLLLARAPHRVWLEECKYPSHKRNEYRDLEGSIHLLLRHWEQSAPG